MSRDLTKVLDSLNGNAERIDEALQTLNQNHQHLVPAVMGQPSKYAESLPNQLPEFEGITICKELHTLELIDEESEDRAQPQPIYDDQSFTSADQLQVAIELVHLAMDVLFRPAETKHFHTLDASQKALLSPHISERLKQMNHYIHRFSHIDGIPNTFLFALGLVLFEWALNRPLKAFWRPEDLAVDGTADPRVDMAVAAHIINWTAPLDQTGYTEAISRLLHCDFDVQDGLLDAAEVRRAVSRGVAGPLLRTLGDMKERLQVMRWHCQLDA